MYRAVAMARATVLVVDDEPNILRTVRTALRAEGYEVETAEDGAAALERLSTRSYDVVLLDVQLPKVGGLEVLQRARAQGLETPVVMMSGHGTIETAVQATRLGARDFLEKPLSTEKLLLTLEHALEVTALRGRVLALERALGSTSALLGDGAAMRELRRVVAPACSSSGWPGSL